MSWYGQADWTVLRGLLPGQAATQALGPPHLLRAHSSGNPGSRAQLPE